MKCLRSRPRPCRRGVATLVVLLMIVIALSVAYVSMRSQTMTLQVQSNADLRASARTAAMTGMAIALQTMQTSAWCDGNGISTVLSRSLGDGSRFEATYTTGDASLLASDPDYDEYPYRVTINVTGYAIQSGPPVHETTHRLRAVVRLTPRALATEPSGWSDITDNTLCQWSEGTFQLMVPFRIEGPVRVRAYMQLSKFDVDWTSDARQYYYQGLNALRLAGQSDYRPFTGPVKFKYSDQYSSTYGLLRTSLGVSTQDTYTNSTSISWPSGSFPSTYRLYSGGKSYTIPSLPSDLRDVTLGPDPKTNPLGVFSRVGCLSMHENVTVQGTILVSGSNADVQFYGANSKLTAFDLPPLQDSASATGSPVRLPTVFAQDDVMLLPGAQVQVTGLVAAMDRFLIEEASQNSIALSLQGKVTATNVQIARRSDWDHSGTWWSIIFGYFLSQRTNYNGNPYFPSWLQQVCGLNMTPQMTIRADSDDIRYHWQNPNDPLYVPNTSDATPIDPSHPGLRWELLTWIDNPQD